MLQKTSEELQQTVTKVINNTTNPVSPECAWPSPFSSRPLQSTTSVKEIVSEDKPVSNSSGSAATPNVGAFSGNFTNCTIKHFSQVTLY